MSSSIIIVFKHFHRHENDVVPKVVEAILNMPETVHINMRYTSVMLLGELCEWISNEQHSDTLGNINKQDLLILI